MNCGSNDPPFGKTNSFFESQPCFRISTHESITKVYSLVEEGRLPNYICQINSLKNKKLVKSIPLLGIYPTEMFTKHFFTKRHAQKYSQQHCLQWPKAENFPKAHKQNGYVNSGTFHNEILYSSVNEQVQIYETIQIRGQQNIL